MLKNAFTVGTRGDVTHYFFFVLFRIMALVLLVVALFAFVDRLSDSTLFEQTYLLHDSSLLLSALPLLQSFDARFPIEELKPYALEAFVKDNGIITLYKPLLTPQGKTRTGEMSLPFASSPSYGSLLFESTPTLSVYRSYKLIPSSEGQQSIITQSIAQSTAQQSQPINWATTQQLAITCPSIPQASIILYPLSTSLKGFVEQTGLPTTGIQEDDISLGVSSGSSLSVLREQIGASTLVILQEINEKNVIRIFFPARKSRESIKGSFATKGLDFKGFKEVGLGCALLSRLSQTQPTLKVFLLPLDLMDIPSHDPQSMISVAPSSILIQASPETLQQQQVSAAIVNALRGGQ